MFNVAEDSSRAGWGKDKPSPDKFCLHRQIFSVFKALASAEYFSPCWIFKNIVTLGLFNLLRSQPRSGDGEGNNFSGTEKDFHVHLEVYSRPTDASNSSNRTSWERIHVISVSFLFSYTYIYTSPSCSICRVPIFEVQLHVHAVSFVHQSKGCESPQCVSFKPSGFGIGLKPLTPFYQALYSWEDFVAGIFWISQRYIQYLQYMCVKMDFFERYALYYAVCYSFMSVYFSRMQTIVLQISYIWAPMWNITAEPDVWLGEIPHTFCVEMKQGPAAASCCRVCQPQHDAVPVEETAPKFVTEAVAGLR